MAKFPEIDTLIVDYPLSETLEFCTLKSRFGPMGQERRKSCWIYPKRTFAVKATQATLAQARTLYNFYLARHGSFEAFNYFFPLQATYAGEYVGTGDGATLVFNLPAKTSTAYKVYVDAVEQTITTNYAFGAGTGADGADLLTFTAEPALGSRITYDFTGYLKVRGRFGEDKLTFETLLDRLVSTGLTIVGDLNA